MKKEIKVVAIILVALIVFLSGYGLGASKGITITIGGEVNVNGGAVNAGAVQQPSQQAQPQTQPSTQPSTQDTTPDAPPADDTPDAPSADNGGSTSAVPSTKEEIAAAYNKAINGFKAYTGNATEKKVETIAIEVKDLPGPVAAIVNPVVEKFTGTTEKEYVFTNGVDADGNKTADRIIPGGRDANVQAAGIAEASATANADGGYTMKIKFVAESSNFDGTQNTSEPEFHKGAMDPLNLGGLDLGPIKIAEAGLDYPGATVEATVDSQGRLIKLVQLLPLGGFGTGKAGPIKATINLEGSMDATYEITYA